VGALIAVGALVAVATRQFSVALIADCSIVDRSAHRVPIHLHQQTVEPHGLRHFCGGVGGLESTRSHSDD
jgi:hypothetical protein